MHSIFFSEAEVWFCHLGENVGVEQDGKGNEFLRPVIILKKFNEQMFWAVPLTSLQKPKSKYYFSFSFQENKKNTALLSQMRILDVKRLKEKMGIMNERDFFLVKKKIKQLLV